MKNNIDIINNFIEPEQAFNYIKNDWKKWVKEEFNKDDLKWVIGISGGIDSTCVAALACKIFGKENVIGVSLPCDGQKDIEDVDKVFNHLGIKRITIDIGDAFSSLKQGLENNCIEPSYDCKTNMPARLRMTALYGVAQSTGGIVLNTCQLTEDVLGYATLYGDNAGSYAPIKGLTKTEVKMLAAWLAVPEELVNKTPIDGLQPLSDEEKLGLKYDDVDKYIRHIGETNRDVERLVMQKFVKNRFKLDIVKIPGPEFMFLTNTILANFGCW